MAPGTRTAAQATAIRARILLRHGLSAAGVILMQWYPPPMTVSISGGSPSLRRSRITVTATAL